MIVTIMTVVVIGIAIAICASLGWNRPGLLVCGVALLVAFVFVVITIVGLDALGAASRARLTNLATRPA